MARLPVLGLALATLAVASCTWLVDTEGLTGDAEAGFPADGPVDVVLVDGTDGPMTDGGVTDGRFCLSRSPAPSFCEDFDTTPLSPVWRPRIDDGGAVTLDETSASSPPRSLRTTMTPPPSDASCRSVYDDHELTIPYVASVRVEYDLRLGDGEAGAYPSDFVALNRVTVAGAGDEGECGYYFLMRPGKAQLVITPASGATQFLSLEGAVASDRWTHVAMEIHGSAEAEAGASGVSVWLDGVLVLDDAAIASDCRHGRLTHVTPGLFCINSSTSSEVETRVDNLVVQAK